MPKLNNLTKPCEIICNFYHSQNSQLPIIFNEKKINLHDSEDNSRKRFVRQMTITEGESLGSGGMKQVYFVDGKALFLILCPDQSRLDAIINEEVTISDRLANMNLKTQNLKQSTIQIYDVIEEIYYEYPCMFADAFSTLSLEQNMEVYDIKNKYRFGSKYKFFHSDVDFLNPDNPIQNRLENLLHDIALVLYSGFELNERDSFNLVFLPLGQNHDITDVRLFLYDFSSKYYSPKLEPSFLQSMPEEDKIKRILVFVISGILYADHIARNGERPYLQPEFINTFFKDIYPHIEERMVSEIKDTILDLINRNKEASTNSYQSKLVEPIGYKQFNFYQPAIQSDTINQCTMSNKENKLF